MSSMYKLIKEWKDNDGLRLIVWVFVGFFLIAFMAIMIESLFWKPLGVPIGIA